MNEFQMTDMRDVSQELMRDGRQALSALLSLFEWEKAVG